MPKSSSLASKIAGLELQLKVLKGQVKKKEKAKKSKQGFSSLYGILKGKSDSTFEEIKAAEIKTPEDL